MSRTFIAEPLRLSEIDLAFPIVRAAAPDIEWSEWTILAESLIQAEEPKQMGIIGLKDAGGYFCGLFTYATMDTLSSGRVLMAENLIAQELIGSGCTEKRLLQAAEDLAKRLRCQSVRANLPIRAISPPPPMIQSPARSGTGLMEVRCPQKSLLRMMQDRGMVPGTVGLEKEIDSRPKLGLVDADS